MLEMKPRFALDLTNDAIGLLERAGDAWVRIGRADLSDPALDQQLATLRQLAEARAPTGFVTKLILPNSQILYLEVDAPGPDRTSRRSQIAAALEGRTPYAVGDLVYDWSRNGRWVRAAVLAKVTLDEAEEFADAHGFRPVAFVAMPENGKFSGEPFFGLTSCADKYLTDGQRLDRDQDPVRLIDAATETAIPDVPEPHSPAAETTSGLSGAGPVDGGVPHTWAQGPDALPTDLKPKTEPAASQIADLGSAAPTVDTALRVDDGEAPFIAIEDEADPFKSDPVADATILPSQMAGTDVDTGRIFDTATIATNGAAIVPNITIGALPDLAPEQDPRAASCGFQSRRAPGPTGNEGTRIAEVARRLGGLGGPHAATSPRVGTLTEAGRPSAAQLKLDRKPKSTAPVARVGAALAKAGAAGLAFGQATVSAGRAQVKGRASAGNVATGSFGVDPPRPTIFGGMPRVAAASKGMSFGLLTVLALVLSIAALALWSLLFTGAPMDTAGGGSVAGVAAPATEPDTDLASDATAESSAATPPPAAANATAEADVLSGTTSEESLPDLPAPNLVAVAPPVPPGALADSAVVLSEARADGTPPAGSPAAVPPTDAQASDAALPPQPLPQPFGTLVRYDAEGLITPTVDGVVAPDGFTIFAAKPPLVPPARPASVAAPSATTDTAAPTAPNPLQGKSPRARPAGLVPTPVPGADDAAAPADAVTAAIQSATLGPLATPADPRHAAGKPQSRPAAIVAAAEATRQNAEAVADAAASAARAEAEAAEAALNGATKQAVASSRRPSSRPPDFAKAVAAARPAQTDAAVAGVASVDAAAVDAALAEAQSQPEPTPEPAAPVEDTQTATQDVDEPEPDDGVPNMATTRTVAKKSTFANAIDLGDINLIGVYGSSANRRALVRMPSGRYVKVQVGDRLDGGKVAAIGDSELSYVKKGKTHILKILNKT